MTNCSNFAKLILTLSAMMLFCAAVLLVPLGLFLTSLPYLLTELIGCLFLGFGLFSGVSLMRVIRRLLC